MSYRPQQPHGPPPAASGPYSHPQGFPNQPLQQPYGFVSPPGGFGGFPGPRRRRRRAVFWFGSVVVIAVIAAVLVTGLVAPGWMRGSAGNCAGAGCTGGDGGGGGGSSHVPPNALAQKFVDALNKKDADATGQMLCSMNNAGTLDANTAIEKIISKNEQLRFDRAHKSGSGDDEGIHGYGFQTRRNDFSAAVSVKQNPAKNVPCMRAVDSADLH